MLEKGPFRASFNALVCCAGGGNSVRRYQSCDDGTCEMVEVGFKAITEGSSVCR